MGSVARRLLLAIPVVLVLLVAAGALVLVLIDWRPLAERAASAAMGRPVQIGSLDIDLGLLTTISVESLQIADQPPNDQRNLLAVDTLDISFKPLSLLAGPAEIPEVTIEGVESHLTRDAEGRGNWMLAPQAETAGELAAPEDRAEFPRLGQLTLRDASFVFEDAVSGLDLDGRIDELSASSNESDGVRLALEGALDDRQLTADFSGGSFSALQGGQEPYPVDLRVSFGDATAQVEGSLLEPVALRGVDLRVQAAGPSVAALFPLIPAALPATPPFQVNGTLRLQEGIWELSDLEGKVGDSDIDGKASFDPGGERPMVTAELHSRRLDLDDLAGLIGEQPDPNETASSEQREDAAEDSGLFPHTPLPAEQLRLSDVDLNYVGESISTALLPLESVDLRLTIKDGRLLAALRSVAIADGKISGEVAVNARDEIPSADADLEIEQLDVKAFFVGTELEPTMSGRFGGELYLLGTGKSLAGILASVEGDGRLTIRDASISGLVVEAIGLDVMEALSVALGEDARLPLRCGVLDYSAERGVVAIDRAVVDTSDSVLVANGEMNLGAESLAMRIEARAKDFSLLDISAPVSVSGPLLEPDIGIGDIDGFPIELGEQEDLNCDALLAIKVDPEE
jgi:uncharacterized protein involved in outer membrane biogenesis